MRIASVAGIDAIFVGPSDLAASLGFPGQANHPVVREAVLDAIRRIRRAGLPPGILTVSEDLYHAAIEAGAVFVSKTIDMLSLQKAVTLRSD
jgi:4-hydroxy-2-oxoheptanedioate aldolase